MRQWLHKVESAVGRLAKPLFHDLLLRSYLYHCVWSVITAHNLTPEKRDYSLRLVGLVPRSSVSLPLGFTAIA